MVAGFRRTIGCDRSGGRSGDPRVSGESAAPCNGAPADAVASDVSRPAATTLPMASTDRLMDSQPVEAGPTVWYFRGSAGGNNSVVECDLAKVEVAGSNPVSRSNFFSHE